MQPVNEVWRSSRERISTLRGVQLASSAFRELEILAPPARWVTWRDSHNWQFVERLPSQALLLKLARQISSVVALDVLLERGLLQEVGAMQRILDEIGEDILFISLALSTNQWSKHHDAYLAHFWDEGGTLPGVQRKSIRAFVNRAFPEQTNPSRADAIGRDLYQAFSDFLHARASAIVSMISGPPPRFHLEGIFDERATRAAREQAPTYGFRCLMSAVAATRAIENGDLAQRTFESFDLFIAEFSDLI